LFASGIETWSDVQVCAKHKASTARAGPKEISVRKFTVEIPGSPTDLRNSFDEFDDFFEEKERKFFIEQKNINLQNFTNRYDEIYNQADRLKNKIEQYQKKNL